MRSVRERWTERQFEGAEQLADICREISHPLRNPADLDPLMERIGNARYVLLGEASHGTSEYYVWRMWLSQRLIQEKGFSFIAVEGDWPDCYRVNRYVKGYREAGASAREVLHAFERWPTWMWANWEIVALAEWLRKHNDSVSDRDRIGFYGLDVYSLWESMDAVIQYLKRTDGSAVEAAMRAYRCFEPYGGDVHDYARATASWVPATCEAEAVAMLAALRREMPDASRDGGEAHFVAEQNALVVKNAETYYRTMVETLERLIRFHGPDAKAIVWEHNTHIGDARATDMAHSGMVNVGQLVREAHRSEDVVLVGFGSQRGKVVAGRQWGAPMERMTVPEARSDSWEGVLHKASHDDKLLLLDDCASQNVCRAPLGHRAIGVVYEPAFESWGNYVPTVLPERYDAFLYLDETRALHPLHIEPRADAEPPETYPWNV